MTNPFLSILWNRTEVSLRRVDQIIFCGYSFPDADMHVKYFLKRVAVNGAHCHRYVVVNNHAGKDDRISREETSRFKRFLGDKVEVTSLSFEEFADDPRAVIAAGTSRTSP
jgi:hypothetical protein